MNMRNGRNAAIAYFIRENVMSKRHHQNSVSPGPGGSNQRRPEARQLNFSTSDQKME